MKFFFIFYFLTHFVYGEKKEPVSSLSRDSSSQHAVSASQPIDKKIKKSSTKKAIDKNQAKKLAKKKTPVKKEIQNKTSLSQKSSSKRRLSNKNPWVCSDHFDSPYKRGHILFYIACTEDSPICLAYSEVKRNECDNDNLIRYFCNPSSEMGFSAQAIPCKKGCDVGKCI